MVESNLEVHTTIIVHKYFIYKIIILDHNNSV